MLPTTSFPAMFSANELGGRECVTGMAPGRQVADLVTSHESHTMSPLTTQVDARNGAYN